MTTTRNEFDALLAELGEHETLAKAAAAAAPDGDKKVAAAAEEAGAELPAGTDPAEQERDEDGEGEGEGEGEGGDDALGKSFKVVLEDGTETEAYDGTAMLKALSAELATVKQSAATQASLLETAALDLAKSLDASAKLFGLVKGQGELIKSLRADMTRYGSQGAGRKAAVTVHEKPGPVASTTAGPSNADVMNKAMTLFEDGKLPGSALARLEAHFARGLPAPADIAARLAA